MIVRRSLLLVIVGLMLVPGPGFAQVRRVRLRMDGYLGAPPEGRREEADLILRVGATDYQFQVTHAVVLSGATHPSNVFDRRRMYKPNFVLRGPKELLAHLTDAKPGTRLRIVGMWIPGSPDFLIASIEPPPAQ